MGGRAWTEEEDDYIRNNYYIQTIPEIGKIINRSRSSIQSRVSNLGLKLKRIPISIEINQEINRLTLKECFIKNGLRYGKFKCSCGREDLIDAQIWYVAKGQIRSCGCIKTEKDSKRFKEMNYKHGMSDTPEHNAWMGIKSRCYNINDSEYENYGGRGIKVSEEWLDDFKNFYNDMGPKPEPKNKYHAGRIDHNDHYRKENCRWITNKEESIDKENGRFILAFGEYRSLLDWSKDIKCKTNIEIIKYRLWKLGWSTEKSIETVTYEG